MGIIMDFFTQMDNCITVGSVLYAVFSVFNKIFRKLRSWLRRKALKKLLENENIVIHIPTRKDVSRLKPLVAMEDYNTAEKLRCLFTDNLFITQIKYIPLGGEIEFEPDKANVVICGPKNSKTIKELFENFTTLNFSEDQQGWFFENVATHEKLRSPQNRKTNQYAFLGKVEYENHEFILICGLHAIGSDGVAFFLNNRKKLDILLKQVHRDKFWCLISSSYREHDRQIYEAELTTHIQRL